MNVETYPLLGELDDVPADYLRTIAETKRFLERWTMDPSYRDEYLADPAVAIAGLGLSLRPEQVFPFIDKDENRRVATAIREGTDPGCPDSVLQYRAFIDEKLNHRASLRDTGYATDPALSVWRRRQIRRGQSELGARRADAIVHAPLAVELSEGCTVGCWFCGVAAPKFDSSWQYTPQNAALWRECLAVLADVVGPSAGHGFLYWATDPLDNPDYESFVTDFHAVLGRCPQTTTAQGPKDVERTRRLLRLAHSLGSPIDRFSIIALNHLYRLHESFSPVEMLRVECVPQNKESSPEHLKSNAGRARRFARKRTKELVKDESSSTIACVSGFLINMPAKRVQLITPCNATEDWPLGYWILDEGHFADAEGLRALLRKMISRSVEVSLPRSAPVRLRPDLTITRTSGALELSAHGLRISYTGRDDFGHLAELIRAGTYTAQQIAERCLEHDGQPLVWTYGLLSTLFDSGMFDEAPPPRADDTRSAAVRALPLVTTPSGV